MLRGKKSFFERLAGVVTIEDEPEEIPVEVHEEPSGAMQESVWGDDDDGSAELTVDVYQTPNEIIIQTMTAGVHPDDVDIDISRDTVIIKGKRLPPNGVTDDDYIYKELYWGPFSRTILLPQEIEAEEANAMEKNGLLVIRLPKIDKDRTKRLKVKSI